MRVFAFFLVLLWSHAALATNTITASIAPPTVELGGTTRYEVTAITESGADIRLTSPPDFEELQILQRVEAPSFSRFNGNARRTITYIWILRSTKTGEFTIAPPGVHIGDEELKANTVSLTVVDQGTLPKQKTKNDQIFVTSELTPTRKHYVGEQISLIYQLFVDARLMDIQPHPPDEPSLDEFWIEDLSQHTAGNRQTLAVNGKLMQKATLRAYALFPIKAGRTEIEPLKLKVVQGGFFRREQSVEVESEPLLLDIQPLPPGAPASFYEGNVGQWAFTVTSDQQSVQVGRSVNIRLTVRGEGLSNRLRIPELPSIDGVRMLTPNEDTRSEIRNLRLFGERSKEIALLPLKPGAINIPPVEFSWFDPTTGTYKTQLSEPLTIQVAPGDAPPEPEEVVSARKRDDSKSDDVLLALLANISTPRVNKEDGFILSQSLVWRGLVGIALMLILGLLGEPLVRRALAKRAPMQERKRQRKELLNQIRAAKDHESLALEVRNFLTLVLDVPKGNLTSTRIRGALIKSQIFNEADSTTIAETLQWCDEKRFAPDKSIDANFENRRSTLLSLLEKTPVPTPATAAAVLLILVVLLVPQSVFADGLKSYEEGRFEDARVLFEADVKSTDSAVAHHNLALAHIKLGNWGLARLHLENASLRSPFDGKIRNDLDTVSKIVRLNAVQQTRIGRVLEGDDLLFWWRAASKVSANSLAILVTLLLFLVIAGLILSRLGKPGHATAALAAVTLAFTLAVWVARDQLLDLQPVVILAQEPILRAGPSSHAQERKDVKGMTQGTLLRVTEVRGNWVKLALSEEDSAWIETPQIGWVK